VLVKYFFVRLLTMHSGPKNQLSIMAFGEMVTPAEKTHGFNISSAAFMMLSEISCWNSAFKSGTSPFFEGEAELQKMPNITPVCAANIHRQKNGGLERT
jgi:hypothetical protein